MGMGAKCFMPYRQYGEHGGVSNPEHAKSLIGFAKRITILGRLGLGKNHHAETLYGPLQFLPLYAGGSRIRFLVIRLEAKVIGLLRLLGGRVVSKHEPRHIGQTFKLYGIALARLWTVW